MAGPLRAVLDTNVLLAAQKTRHSSSPNAEIFNRWKAGELAVLCSRDIAIEYADKMLEHGIPEVYISTFLSLLRVLAEWVEIEFFHLRHYPIDSDDVSFLLCALNGEATHLVTYDEHLTALQPHYKLHICEPVKFLQDCRGVQ